MTAHDSETVCAVCTRMCQCSQSQVSAFGCGRPRVRVRVCQGPGPEPGAHATRRHMHVCDCNIIFLYCVRPRFRLTLSYVPVLKRRRGGKALQQFSAYRYAIGLCPNSPPQPQREPLMPILHKNQQAPFAIHPYRTFIAQPENLKLLNQTIASLCQTYGKYNRVR